MFVKTACTALALTLALPFVATAQNAPKRAIEQVAGDVYRFQNNFHYSLVVMTEDGVVVSDPINAEAAAWLEAELAKMTDKPVTHLIYSHSHGDHASGGAVYADTATVIAHANAPADIDGVVPDTRFDDTLTLEVGGKTFEMTYLGEGHGSDLIATVVRPENVVFIVDAAAPKRLPFRDFGGADIDAWMQQIETAKGLEFDIFAPGHGPVGTKADLIDAQTYMTELRAAVLEGLKAGKTPDELVETIKMEDYSDWQAYDDWLALNIQGMARFLQDSGQVN